MLAAKHKAHSFFFPLMAFLSSLSEASAEARFGFKTLDYT